MKRWRLARAVAVALVSLVLIAGCSSSSSIAPPKPTALSQADQGRLSQTALDSFASALTSPSPAGATPAERTALQAARQMHVQNVSLQYVDSIALTASDLQRFGTSAWAAEVSASYRLPFDPGPTEMTIAMVFMPVHGSAQIVSIGGHGDRSALWLDTPTSIATKHRLVVIDTVPSSLGYFVRLGESALTTVAKVLPGWHGTLVIEVPQSQDQLDDVLQSPAQQLADIAAVTTTADGTLTRGSPIHVFANPAVFNSMSPLGARVVMSHESTHVATQGPLTTMPTWMLEGFADFVALDHAGIPVQTAAHQIIARMAGQGVPTHLPTSEDLAPTAGGLGATYEEAWLAWRYLGLTYGEVRAVAFYEAVRNGASVQRAFVNVLGTTEGAFVQGWRANLRQLVNERPR